MKNILKKCIEELAKENPKLDYIRGMLEVLVEQDTAVPVAGFIPSGYSELSKPIQTTPNPQANPSRIPENDAFKVLSGNPIV